jgi:hypothetical protein
MSEETRIKLSLPELVEPPEKPYLNPFPPKGRCYDYKFVKEVMVLKLFVKNKIIRKIIQILFCFL